MTDWTIRPATVADREAVVTLLREAHGSDVRTNEEWDWLFRGRLSHYAVADTGHGLAGQYALLPQRVVHRGVERGALMSLDTATHPDYMRRGLMRLLGETAYAPPGAELIYGFPNSTSAPGLYRKLGWTEIEPFPLYLRPLRSLLPALVRGAPRLPGRRRQPRGAEITDRFASWADELWRERLPTIGTGVVRDSAYLNWRYADAPFEYRIFVTAGRDGFAVVRIAPWRHGRLAYLMDAAGAAGPALDAAIAYADAGRAAALVALITPRDPLAADLRERGFRRAPARARAPFSFGVRATGELAAHAELFTLPEWHLTAGDFDHV